MYKIKEKSDFTNILYMKHADSVQLAFPQHV